jgi:peptidyl-dipeptidase A
MRLRDFRLIVMTALIASCLPLGIPHASAEDATSTMDDQARQFLQGYLDEIRPVEIEVNRAWWEANTSGKDEDFARKEEAENRLNTLLSDRAAFEQLKALREGPLSDLVLHRQIQLLYLQYLGKQVDPDLLRQMTAKANEIEQAFNVFRAEVDGESLTDSQVRKVLSESSDSARRKAVWQASKRVGEVVEADLRELVRLRNESARQLGFTDYHSLQLALNEQNADELLALFDQLDQLTRGPFRQAKAEIDRRLAERYGIAVSELRPWHYHDPFFQEAPRVYDVNLDDAFQGVDIPRVCREFYAGIGLPIDEVLARSDLYERAGKSPHAFCTDMDRQGDVRVLANIVPNEYWMSTLLHELGHAVYSSRFIPQNVPYVLRTDAHILCTEGVAMMFERFGKSSTWLAAMGVDVPDPASFDQAGRRMRRDQLLIFSRWCQVMLRFERSMYTNPDQDLNRLWWDLVEQYQQLHRPEDRYLPDFASKIHVVSAPAYYHNYMLGELFACQLHAAIAREVLESDEPSTAIYHNNPAIGQFMKDKVFAHGRLLPWNDMTRQATGAPLNAKAFAAELNAVPSP